MTCQPPPPSTVEHSRTCGTSSASISNKIPRLEPRRRRAGPSNPTPVPEAAALPSPPDTRNWSFEKPKRRILTAQDHKIFLASPTNELVKAWIFALTESVVETPNSAVKDADLSSGVKTLLRILTQAEDDVQNCPPDEQGGSRFGNKAFRSFLDRITSNSKRWHNDLGLQDPHAVEELSTYFQESFGNYDRIDYGSGHELNFAMWLLCLHRLRLLTNTDFKPLVICVFTKYLSLMRRVQMTYYLEPAGSHGVWGLDDYQFLPFLFGASQLLRHPFITPRAIHQDLSLEEFSDQYMYLSQVSFVNSTKTVKGLRWHSPMLDDISSARSWEKIDGGMRRMFVAEVLGKLPVMQHFLFGSLIPAVSGMSDGSSEDDPAAAELDTHVGHAHNGTGWGDCCGIKVPSSIAAAQEMRKGGQGVSLRRIPFD